jgi:tetratricopeptide (TPR) repeat protein
MAENMTTKRISSALKIMLEDRLEASVTRIAAIFAAIVGLMQGLEFFGFDIRPYLANKYISTIFLILIVYLSIELLLARRHIERGNSTSKAFMQSLEDELSRLFKEKQFRRILRLRDSMSRYLWVEGALKARSMLGEFAEEAALQLGDKKSQVAALIDDLGWTLVAAKDYDRANQCIMHGARLASEEGLMYWEAKAHRHRAGMLTIQKEHAKAYEELEKSRPLAEKIEDPIKRQEILAGIEYAIAVTALDEDDLVKAEEHVRKSDQIRRDVGDTSRIIRCVSLMGKIELKKGNLVSAKDYFRKGLEEATTIGRRDEMIRNHLGLSSIFKKENDFEKAQFHKDKADELRVDTPVPYEIDDAQSKL